MYQQMVSHFQAAVKHQDHNLHWDRSTNEMRRRATLSAYYGPDGFTKCLYPRQKKNTELSEEALFLIIWLSLRRITGRKVARC